MTELFNHIKLRRNLLATGFMIVALSASFMSMMYFMRGELGFASDRGLELAFIGIFFTVLTLIFYEDYHQKLPIAPKEYKPKREPSLSWYHYLCVGLGVLMLAILAEINGNILDIEPLRRVKHDIQFILLVGGILALLVGASGWQFKYLRILRAWLYVRKIEILMVTLITLFGLSLRLFEMGVIQGFVDEIHFSSPLITFRNTEYIKLLRPLNTVAAFPYLYSYIQSWGTSTLGNTMEGMRIASAFFGALTLPPVYMLTKHLFDRRTALIATVLLAVLPVHLQFSRIGLNNIADPLFGVMSLAFLARALRYGGRGNFVISGIALGMTQYFYEGGRLLYPLLVFIWVGFHIWRWRSAMRELAILLFCFIVMAMPIYYTLVGIDRPIFQRMETARISEDFWETETVSEVQARLLERLKFHTLVFLSRPEDQLYYAGDDPFIFFGLVPGFLLGLGVLLIRWYQKRESLLLMWTASAMLAITLTLNMVTSARFVVIFPALTMIVAVGLRYSVAILTSNLRRNDAILSVAVIVLSILQVDFYFGYHIPRFNEQHIYHQPGQEVLFMLDVLPYGSHIHIIHNPPIRESDARAMIAYFREGFSVSTRAPQEIDTEYLNQLEADVPHIFFIERYDIDTLAKLQASFILTGPYEINLPYRPVQFFVFFMTMIEAPSS